MSQTSPYQNPPVQLIFNSSHHQSPTTHLGELNQVSYLSTLSSAADTITTLAAIQHLLGESPLFQSQPRDKYAKIEKVLSALQRKPPHEVLQYIDHGAGTETYALPNTICPELVFKYVAYENDDIVQQHSFIRYAARVGLSYIFTPFAYFDLHTRPMRQYVPFPAEDTTYPRELSKLVIQARVKPLPQIAGQQNIGEIPYHDSPIINPETSNPVPYHIIEPLTNLNHAWVQYFTNYFGIHALEVLSSWLANGTISNVTNDNIGYWSLAPTIFSFTSHQEEIY